VHSATRVWFSAPRQVPTSQVPKLPRYFRFWASVNRSTELVPNLPSSLAAHEAHQQNNRPTAHSPPPAITLALHAPRAPPDLPRPPQPPPPRSRKCAAARRRRLAPLPTRRRLPTPSRAAVQAQARCAAAPCGLARPSAVRGARRPPLPQALSLGDRTVRRPPPRVVRRPCAGEGAAAARGVGPGVREREAERLGGRKGRGGACAAGAAAATRRARR